MGNKRPSKNNMKTLKEYRRPLLVVEQFTPNAFVAACETTELWRVKVEDVMNIGGLVDPTVGGEFYFETNGIPGLQKSGDNPDTWVQGKPYTIPDSCVQDGYVYFDNCGQLGYFTNNNDITVECMVMGEALMYGNWGDPNNLWHTGSHIFCSTTLEKIVNTNGS